jgi:hypothetical protein
MMKAAGKAPESAISVNAYAFSPGGVKEYPVNRPNDAEPIGSGRRLRRKRVCRQQKASQTTRLWASEGLKNGARRRVAQDPVLCHAKCH